MAQAKMKAPANAVERNIQLTGEIMRYLMAHPQVFDSLPDKFELIILPEDDPEIRQYNLDLLDKYGSEGKPIVFARLTSRQGATPTYPPPSLFVPLPFAA
ncbi:MAG: hypothetical protein HY872_07070 [Chloroflexi bacterium]|nr:hypothetical protein [Chloroflexota bacterium]